MSKVTTRTDAAEKPTEIVVLSGKGGTGKTTVTAALADLMDDCVIADCDVDAADLHILLSPDIRQRTEFVSGSLAVIDQEKCIGCGACLASCRFEAVIRHNGSEPSFTISPFLCEGCGVCAHVCPVDAVVLLPDSCGEWYESSTRLGPLVHARLNPGAGNSGRLVSLVKEKAREKTQDNGHQYLLVDGPPGIGCPVIASLSGASVVLVVTEPTVSGAHDLERVLALTRHFQIPAAICINKADINPEQSRTVEEQAEKLGAPCLARINYSKGVSEAQKNRQTLIEYGTSTADEIRHLWRNLTQFIETKKQEPSQRP